MFSSCLETIEPEGLSDLRGAKADLLRAQTALQEAQAAKVNAEAALVLAEAKVQEALAKQKEAEIAYIEVEIKQMEAMVEYQNLLNEREAIINAGMEAANAAEAEAARIANELALAELEARLAEIEAAKATAAIEAEKAAAWLEEELLRAQTALLTAQAAYEVAMKELAAAKVALSPAQVAYLAPFKYDVAVAQLEVDNLATQLETAAENLAAAIATVDKNKADKLAIRTAELDVVAKEAALLGAQEAVEIAKATLELDPKVTDWVAEKAELEAEYDAMEKAKLEALLETEDKNAELEAKYNELRDAYLEYTAATGFSFNEETGEFSVVPGSKTPLTAPEIYIASPKDEEGNNLFWYGDFHVADPKFKYGDADAYGIVSAFEDEIENYSIINNEWYDTQIESAEAVIAGVEKQNEDLYEKYETAVAAYKAGDPVAYQKYLDEDYDIETPVAEYNTALKAFVAALDAWNEAQKKYASPDTQEEEAAALADYNEAERAAYAVYMKARQDALDAYHAEDVKWQNADLAYTRAKRTYEAILGAAVTTVGALDNYPVYTTINAVAADLTAAIKAYNDAKAAATAANDATFDADKKWATDVATYEAELKKVNDAQKAFDDTADVTNKKDAQSVYDAAYEAWIKADPALTKAYEEAYDAYDKVKSTAWQTYQDILADLGVGATGMDSEYEDYLRTEYENSRTALDNAINNLVTIKKWVYTDVVMGDEDYVVYEVEHPDFLVDVDTQTLKEIEVEDVIDNEFFLANTVTSLAGQISASGAYYFGYDDIDGRSHLDYHYVVIGAPENYPLELPTYESYTENYPEDIWSHIYNLYTNDRDQIISEGASVWLENYGIFGSTPLESIFEQMSYIAQYEEDKNDLDAAAAHVEVLEAAKAEFEAYVAAEEERIDALRTMVEAEWAENAEAIKAFKEAQIAYDAEMAEIQRVVDHITIMIDTYIGTTNVEFFVSTLEATYATCVEAVDEAEFNLELAKDQLEVVKAGGKNAISAVELAQKAYDKLNAKLQEALAELEAAADALEEAMAAIGEGTVEEEAPEAPETPAE